MTDPTPHDPVVAVEQQRARQRFAVSAENTDPTPWFWSVTDGEVVAYGQASWRWTARLKAAWHVWRMRRAHRLLRQTNE